MMHTNRDLFQRTEMRFVPRTSSTHEIRGEY